MTHRQDLRELGPIRIGFALDPVMEKAGFVEAVIDDDPDQLASRYRAFLRRELPARLRETRVRTHGRVPLPMGGPFTVQVDWVELVVRGVEAYVAFRFLADDIRRVTDRLRKIADGQVYVDADAAVVLAADAVATERYGPDWVNNSPRLTISKCAPSSR